MSRLFAATALLSIFVALPAQAAAPACWSREDIAAAKVRDLDMLLTEISARCVAAGLSSSADYDAYAVVSRGALSAVGQRLKARFWTVYRSEEHTSELQSLMRISYAVFCLKKKKT